MDIAIDYAKPPIGGSGGFNTEEPMAARRREAAKRLPELHKTIVMASVPSVDLVMALGGPQ